MKVVDVEGKTVTQLRSRREPGLHRLTWILTLATDGGGFGGMGKGDFKGGKGQPPADKGEALRLRARTALSSSSTALGSAKFCAWKPSCASTWRRSTNPSISTISLNGRRGTGYSTSPR